MFKFDHVATTHISTKIGLLVTKVRSAMFDGFFIEILWSDEQNWDFLHRATYIQYILKFSYNEVQYRPAIIGYITRILINIYARKLKE